MDAANPMDQSEGPQWRWRCFVVSHVAAALLVASWVLPPTGGWWDGLDEAAFQVFNSSLEAGWTWQFFWAVANHRSVDLFSGTLATLVVIWWLWGQPRDVQNWRCAMLGGLAIPVILLPFGAHEVLEFLFNYERPSPTIVHSDAVRLTQLFPAMETKDASRHSFPGDHAFVLFSIVLFYGYFGARKFVIISTVMAVIFMLPRMVGGAHWLTDNIMGGLVPALVVTAWVLATPIGYYLARPWLPIVRFFVGIMPVWLRIPEGRGPA